MSKRNLAKAMLGLYNAAGRGQRGGQVVLEAFQAKKFDVKDFSIKALALEVCGDEWFEDLRPAGGIRFIESAPVDSTAFANLANVVLSGRIIEEFGEADINTGDEYATTEDTPYIDQGRDIEIRRTDAVSTTVKEGRSFARYGLSENWKTYFPTEKRGAIIELTKEAVAEDRTGSLLRQATTVVDEVAMEKNERILKVVLGIDDNLYSPQGVAQATYSTALTGRINKQTGTELVDWTDVDSAIQIWTSMTHPVTGRPIFIPASDMRVLVMPAKLATANYVFKATDLSVGDADGGASSGVTTGPNPIADIISRGGISTRNSSVLANYLLTLATASGGGGVAAADAAKYWYMGAFAKAFVYHQNYPLTILTRGAGTPEEFDRDVIFQIRAAERGRMNVREPRYVAQFTG